MAKWFTTRFKANKDALKRRVPSLFVFLLYSQSIAWCVLLGQLPVVHPHMQVIVRIVQPAVSNHRRVPTSSPFGSVIVHCNVMMEGNCLDSLTRGSAPGDR